MDAQLCKKEKQHAPPGDPTNDRASDILGVTRGYKKRPSVKKYDC